MLVTGAVPVFDSSPRAGIRAAVPATMQIYFQQAGDDFSGAGPKQYYRWWSAQRQTLG